MESAETSFCVVEDACSDLRVQDSAGAEHDELDLQRNITLLLLLVLISNITSLSRGLPPLSLSNDLSSDDMMEQEQKMTLVMVNRNTSTVLGNRVYFSFRAEKRGVTKRESKT